MAFKVIYFVHSVKLVTVKFPVPSRKGLQRRGGADHAF